MKIYILPLQDKFQPAPSKTRYPRHNKRDFGIEQDFLGYLGRNPGIVTDNPHVADWHYLPIYWTRYHRSHNYGKFGLESLQKEVGKRIIDDARTFTICQYADGPLVDLGETTLFFASRQEGDGFDIPLLCYPHKIPLIKPRKRYVGSFVGRLETHPVRLKMERCLRERTDVDIRDGNRGTRFFVKQMLQSYIALCPRGYGGTSFRFYEAMQLGVAPLLISDIDARPFKTFLDWDKISLYARSADEASNMLDAYTIKELLELGKSASRAWQEKLTFGKWCGYVLKELETIS